MIILVVLLVVLAIAVIVRPPRRIRAIFYVIMAGVLYGFVATLAKVVLARVEQGEFDWLTLDCVIALLVATALGAYFVQNAHRAARPGHRRPDRRRSDGRGAHRHHRPR